MDVEVEEFQKFKFSTKIFNLYDPHGLFRDHYVRVYYSWSHGACHCLEEDPWRYCYNSSRLNEPVNMAVERLPEFKVVTP